VNSLTVLPAVEHVPVNSGCDVPVTQLADPDKWKQTLSFAPEYTHIVFDPTRSLSVSAENVKVKKSKLRF